MPIVMLAALLTACGGTAPRPGLAVSRADYGDRWPFTVERGTLRCTPESPRSDRRFVTLETDKRIEFGLNGAAIGFGFPDVREALQPGKTGADVQPFIALGLPLCDTDGSR
jgi:hypothetical protein